MGKSNVGTDNDNDKAHAGWRTALSFRDVEVGSGPAPVAWMREAQRLLWDCAAFAREVAAATPRDPPRGLFDPSPRSLEEVPDRLREWAMDLLPYLALLAQHPGTLVPQEVIREGHRLADLFETPTRKPLATWQQGLVRTMEERVRWMGPDAYPFVANADINAAGTIVDGIAEHVGVAALPSEMRFRGSSKAAREKFERAAAVLRKVRIAAPGQRAGGRGRRVSPFAAAALFAAAFGLKFPERERDLVRQNKSGRRVSPRTDSASREAAPASDSPHAARSSPRRDPPARPARRTRPASRG